MRRVLLLHRLVAGDVHFLYALWLGFALTVALAAALLAPHRVLDPVLAGAPPGAWWQGCLEVFLRLGAVAVPVFIILAELPLVAAVALWLLLVVAFKLRDLLGELGWHRALYEGTVRPWCTGNYPFRRFAVDGEGGEILVVWLPGARKLFSGEAARAVARLSPDGAFHTACPGEDLGPGGPGRRCVVAVPYSPEKAGALCRMGYEQVSQRKLLATFGRWAEHRQGLVAYRQELRRKRERVRSSPLWRLAARVLGWQRGKGRW
ncbi:hypothetical protein [Ammonifex thiophilus]|uniref:Uncharacterized protein n=1 Tax=Ammonifex thiophilus TaxID=444093 RepID=A0A3D8P4K1_9THEO|nr:hypothetical protein [Ammonifex thiophilus]RDV82342.1 hypothetical protein DXX99_07985 [Ammonifex thiophilus]